MLRRHRVKLGDGVERDEVERWYRCCSAGSPITLAPPGDVVVRLVGRGGGGGEGRGEGVDA